MKTYNDRRGILSTFLKFSFQRGWIAENPIPKVPHYRIRRKRGVAQTFTVPQARTLMEHFETFEDGRWVPYFALCLFAGTRSAVQWTGSTSTDAMACRQILGLKPHAAREIITFHRLTWCS
jgi:hypothetical protein